MSMPQTATLPPVTFDAPRALVFILASLIAAVISRSLALPAGHCVAMSLFNGVLLAAFLLSTARTWPRWSTLAFVMALIVDAGIQRAPMPIALADATGHVAGMLLAAWLIGRFHAPPFRLQTPRDVLLLSVSITLGAVVGASVEAVISLVGHGHTSAMEWTRNWTAGMGGILAAAMILTLYGNRGQSSLWAAGRRWEAAAVLLVLVIVSHWVFSTRIPLVFFLLPFFVWCALRFDTVAMSVGLALVSGIALHHTGMGAGPYAAPAYEPDAVAIFVQLFIFVAACGSLVLSAVTTQRQTMLQALHRAQAELEERVEARTAALRDSEASLRENAERFRLARTAAKIIVADWDVAHDELHLSDSPEWLRGPLPESGKYPLFKLQVHPDDREHFLQSRDETVRTLRGGTIGFRMVRTDGVVLHVEASRTVVAGPDGKAARLVAVLQDITARKQAEIALRESEQRLRTLLDAIPDEVRLKDTAGRYIMVNRAAQRQMGLPEVDILGKTVFELRPPHVAQHIDEQDRRALAAKEPLRVDRTGDRQADAWREAILAPVRDVAGEVTGLVSISRDISARKAAEMEALRLREEQYRALVEQATDLIYRTDPYGNFTYFNSDAALMRTIGYARQELLGRNYLDFVHPDFRAQTAAFYHAQFSHRDVASYYEFPAVSRDGRTVWVGQHVNVVIDHGRILYHQGVCREITERVTAQQALRESNAQLRRLAARQEEMLEAERTKLAHDLHDGIGQSINLARIKLSDLAGQRDPGALNAAIGEVTAIIDDARAVIRTLEFDLSPPVLRELGLEPALDWLAEQMMQDYGLRVSLSRDDEEKALSQAHRVVVFRAVRELLINVARHADTREAHVDTQCQDGLLVVTVSDEGTGFDTANTAKGLGLTGVRERFAHMGGSMQIVSAPGEGTVATLTLPLGD